jgi:hypothetical protein
MDIHLGHAKAIQNVIKIKHGLQSFLRKIHFEMKFTKNKKKYVGGA